MMDTQQSKQFVKSYRYKLKNADNIFNIKYTLEDNTKIEAQPVIISQKKLKESEPTQNKPQKPATLQKQQKKQPVPKEILIPEKPKSKKQKKVKELVMTEQDFSIYAKFNKINKKKMKINIKEEEDFFALNKKPKQRKKNKKNKDQRRGKQREFSSDDQELDNMYDLLMDEGNFESDDEEMDKLGKFLQEEAKLISKRSKSNQYKINKRNQVNRRKQNREIKTQNKSIIFQEYIDIEEIQDSRENDEQKYFKGFVDFNQRVKQYAKIMTKEIQGECQAEGIHKNRCIQGDEVYFEVLDDSGEKIKCKIVAILPWKGKGERNVVGKVQFRRDKNSLYLVPINKKIYTFDVKLNNISKGDLMKSNQKYFLAEILGWKRNKQYPECKIIKEFGELGDIQTETHALLINNGVADQQYDQETIEKGLKKFIDRADENGEYKIPQEEILKRNDLRQERIFTIDPLTARDFDDALSIEECGVKNGQKIYEIGVHIADASYFVEEGGSIDEVAQRKTTSVYLVHRVIPMLPRILCETMCSLNPGLQRLTLSVWFKITQSGQVLEGCRYEKTVIKSKARFTYEQAQQIIQNEVKSQQQIDAGFGCVDSKDFDKIANDIKIMNRLAMILRQDRIDGGSLIFQTPKKTFQLDQNLYPKSYTINKRFAANFLVEEYMLLANQKVGEILVNKIGCSALLRKHKFPGPKKIAKFQAFAKRINQQITISPQVKIQEELDKVFKDPTVKECIKSILNHELIFLLEMAEYFVIGDSPKSEWLHFALNMPTYTHFTSPIRRYPDIIVHRQLSAIIDSEKSKKEIEIPHYKNLKDLVDRCNQNKMSAKKVSSGCQKIFLCLYLKKNPVDCKAVLTDMNEYCLNVSVPSYDFRSTIQLKELKKMKMLQIRKDKKERKIMDVQGEYQMEGQTKKIKFYLKELQEIDVRLTGKEGFPIDYQIRLVIPHPEIPHGTISFQ